MPSSKEPQGLHLSDDSLQYVDKKTAEDIQYVTFLIMARAGIRALEFYDPTSKKHGQAHMQARYGVLTALILLKP